MILVVSSSGDPHARRVRAEMQRRGIAVGSLDPRAFGGLGGVSVALTGAGELDGSLDVRGLPVLAEDVRAVYCPSPLDPHTSAALDELWELLDVGAVPGTPAVIERASSVERQRQIAAKVGFELASGAVVSSLPGETELAVVVAGYRVFGAALHRGVDEATDITPAVLPVALAERCREMTEELGLAYAVLYVSIGTEGRAVFRSLDPFGAFADVEDATALPITRALVDLLLTEAAGISMTTDDRLLSVHPSKPARLTPFLRIAKALS